MSKVISILFLFVLVTSCATQKTVELANGTMVTQKQYEKMLNHASNAGHKAGVKAVKGKMSRKQIREFRNELSVEVDTLGN